MQNNFKALNNGYVYLNSASTTYICDKVLDEMNSYYKNNGANAGRGIDTLGFEVTKKIEDTRACVAEFLNVKQEEIVFTRGTTASLNLVANSFGNIVVNEGDEIIVSVIEHHSNFVPWQKLAERKKAKFVVVDVLEDGRLDMKDLENKLNSKTKVVAINHSSNTFGSINDLEKISSLVHQFNAYLVVDGAQGIINEKANASLVDFYAFSAHKIYGPKGIGVLYGKKELLDQMEPMEYGGEMVDVVDIRNTTYKETPYKFEAGTLMIPEIIGLKAAIEFISDLGYKNMNDHIYELRKYTVSKLESSDIIIYNKENENSNLITFNFKNIHAHDVATVLDKNKIIVRAGHHCAEVMMKKLGVPSTLRVSFGIYNTKSDCDKLIEALDKVGDYIDVLF